MKKTALVLLCALLLAGCVRREVPAPSSAPDSAPDPAAPSSAPDSAPDPAAPSPEGEAPESGHDAAPTPSTAPESTPDPAQPVKAGRYLWDGGEQGQWTLHLKENGTFSLIGPERIYNGEGWSDNGDGTVVTGPTEGAGAASFFDEFGSSRWRVSGEMCEPAA